MSVISTNFPGHISMMGAIRGRNAAIGGVVGTAAAFGAAGGLGSWALSEGDDRSNILRHVGIGLAAAGVGALLGYGLVREGFGGPNFGGATGRNSFQRGTGRFEPVQVTKPVTDASGKEIGTVTVTEMREVMETVWYDASGTMSLDRLVGSKRGYASVEDARAAAGDQWVLGMKLDGDRIHNVSVTSSGLESTRHFEPIADPRIAYSTLP